MADAESPPTGVGFYFFTVNAFFEMFLFLRALDLTVMFFVHTI
jgi:hypothetical protein